jgi:hypothetical protein
MLKNRILGLFLLAAFTFTTTALLAQAKPQEKKAQDKKGVELIEPVKPEKPKGKEKIMIYNGEYLKVQLYGFIKMDMVYNTADVLNESGPFRVENQVFFLNPINPAGTFLTSLAIGGGHTIPVGAPRVAIKKTSSQKSGSFVIDMRTSRLGLIVNGPKVLGADTKGNIEIDFWGSTAVSGAGARQGIPMIRHGYVQLDWKTDMYAAYLVFGQTWSLNMSMPAQPNTLTYVPFGENGNIFIREPMIWFGQKFGNDNYNVVLDLAIARVLGGSDSGLATDLYPGVNGVQADNRGPGEASMRPGGRARLYFTIKPNDIFSLTLGGSGHYQWEKHAMTFANLANQYIWGLNGTATTPLTVAQAGILSQRWGRLTRSYSAHGFGKMTISLITFVGAYWRGVNMDSFTCGLGQNGAVENLSSTKILGIPTQGGYAQIQIDLRKVGPIPILLTGGYGASKKSNRRYITAGNMLWNETIHGTIQWYLNDYLWLGFEYARHQSKWKGDLGSAFDHRYHTGVMLSF